MRTKGRTKANFCVSRSDIFFMRMSNMAVFFSTEKRVEDSSWLLEPAIFLMNHFICYDQEVKECERKGKGEYRKGIFHYFFLRPTRSTSLIHLFILYFQAGSSITSATTTSTFVALGQGLYTLYQLALPHTCRYMLMAS